MALLNEFEDFDKDMKDFETRLKVLRAEFNQYMNGSLKFPPNFQEAQIRKIIKKYALTEGLKGVQRFHYFNLVAKFQTMMEFYSRRIREKEKGVRHPYGMMSAEKEEQIKTTVETSKKAQEVDLGHIIADPARQTTAVKDMYDLWNEKASHSTKPAPPMDYEKFVNMLKSKTEELRKVKNCKAVRYRILLEKGQVRIKAKPI